MFCIILEVGLLAGRLVCLTYFNGVVSLYYNLVFFFLFLLLFYLLSFSSYVVIVGSSIDFTSKPFGPLINENHLYSIWLP